MATDYLDLTTEANVLPTVIASKALGRLASNMVLAGVVNRDYDDEIAEQGQTVTIGIRGSISANDKSEGADVTVQAPTKAKKDVTLSNHKEVTFGEEDIAGMLSGNKDDMEGYMQDGAIALLEAIEGSIAGLYSGFSQTIDATAGLAEDDFRESRRLLNSAKAPGRGRFAVLHEDAEYEALGIERIVNRDYAQAFGVSMDLANYTGSFAGFDILLNQNIKVASTEAKNIFGHRNCAVLATRPMRQTRSTAVSQVVMNENGIGLRVTLWYDPKALAEVITIDIIYGVGELRDDHAVVVSTSEI